MENKRKKGNGEDSQKRQGSVWHGSEWLAKARVAGRQGCVVKVALEGHVAHLVITATKWQHTDASLRRLQTASDGTYLLSSIVVWWTPRYIPQNWSRRQTSFCVGYSGDSMCFANVKIPRRKKKILTIVLSKSNCTCTTKRLSWGWRGSLCPKRWPHKRFVQIWCTGPWCLGSFRRSKSISRLCTSLDIVLKNTIIPIS